MNTPWGRSQGSEKYAEGITFFWTASHGGFRLSNERLEQMPKVLRKLGQGARNMWFEEDCEWCAVALAFPDVFDERDVRLGHRKRTVDGAKRILMSYYPDAYEELTGRELKPGESSAKDRELFQREHQHEYISVSAYGRWADWVPEGMTGVFATIGGSRGGWSWEQGRYFLVPRDEYANRSPYGFIVDLNRHEEVERAKVTA